MCSFPPIFAHLIYTSSPGTAPRTTMTPGPRGALCHAHGPRETREALHSRGHKPFIYLQVSAGGECRAEIAAEIYTCLSAQTEEPIAYRDGLLEPACLESSARRAPPPLLLPSAAASSPPLRPHPPPPPCHPSQPVHLQRGLNSIIKNDHQRAHCKQICSRWRLAHKHRSRRVAFCSHVLRQCACFTRSSPPHPTPPHHHSPPLLSSTPHFFPFFSPPPPACFPSGHLNTTGDCLMSLLQLWETVGRLRRDICHQMKSRIFTQTTSSQSARQEGFERLHALFN